MLWRRASGIWRWFGLQTRFVLWRHTATAIPFIYSLSGIRAASAPISTFICLWAIYILQGSVHIFPPAEKADPSWEYIIHSQKHECGNWDWGPDVPFLGIFVSNFRHFFFAGACAAKLRTNSCEILDRTINFIYKKRTLPSACGFVFGHIQPLFSGEES